MSPDPGPAMSLSYISLVSLFSCFFEPVHQTFFGIKKGICASLICREQMEQLAEVLQQADPILMDQLARLGCQECYFAYRMLLVLMRRDLKLPEVGACPKKMNGGVTGMLQINHHKTVCFETCLPQNLQQIAQADSLLQAMRLWEMLWARRGLAALSGAEPQPNRSRNLQSRAAAEAGGESKTPDLLVLVIASAIRHKRQAILKICRSSDDVMALFSTQQRLSLWTLLRGANKLMKSLKVQLPLCGI